MNKRQAAKTDMLRGVRDFRANPSYTSTVNSVLALAAAFDAHAEDITLIELLDTQRAGAAVGGGPAKETARDQYERSGLTLDGMFTALAANTANADMLNQFDNEASDLRNMREEDLRIHGQTIAALLAIPANVTALAPYGLDAAKTTLFTQRYTAFHTLINLPAARAAQEGTFVQLIADTIAAADRRLDLVMDKLIRQFGESHPALVAAYDQARVIIDPAGGGEDEPPTPTPP